MSKTTASRVTGVGKTAAFVFVLAAVLAGCSGEDAVSGNQEEAGSAVPLQAKDDYATTSGGREVMIEMVANDTGESLGIDRFDPEGTNGDIICEAGVEPQRIRSCAYTPAENFFGTDKFEYTVKDVNGKTDTAMVYVRVKPES